VSHPSLPRQRTATQFMSEEYVKIFPRIGIELMTPYRQQPAILRDFGCRVDLSYIAVQIRMDLRNAVHMHVFKRLFGGLVVRGVS
jgi:hypothetical protein